MHKKTNVKCHFNFAMISIQKKIDTGFDSVVDVTSLIDTVSLRSLSVNLSSTSTCRDSVVQALVLKIKGASVPRLQATPSRSVFIKIRKLSKSSKKAMRWFHNIRAFPYSLATGRNTSTKASFIDTHKPNFTMFKEERAAQRYNLRWWQSSDMNISATS